jgi:hypothetical protein
MPPSEGQEIKLDVLEDAREDTQSAAEEGDRRLRLRRMNAQFNVLSTDLTDFSESVTTSTVRPERFWRSVHMQSPVALSLGRKEDPYHDYTEKSVKVIRTPVPSLKECRCYLRNDEADAYHKRSETIIHRVSNVILDYAAATWMYIANTYVPRCRHPRAAPFLLPSSHLDDLSCQSYRVTLESTVAVLNAVFATYFYCRNADRLSAKLDFAFLAFSVVFPLTFLIQSVFSRRDQALQRLADFKGAVLAAVLMTLTCDWATSDGSSTTMGRLELPPQFNRIVVQDFRNLVLLVYEYLSMPQVSHARNVVSDLTCISLFDQCRLQRLSCTHSIIETNTDRSFCPNNNRPDAFTPCKIPLYRKSTIPCLT